MFIGLPQWQHPAWHKFGLRPPADYAQYFNCVKCNTTFYALPSADSVLRWRDMTSDSFRFCFKFPATISHQEGLHHYEEETRQFFHCLQPLASRVGQFWLQLPAAFSPEQRPDLWCFLDTLPQEFSYGVEVRHLAFFAKGEDEQQLNQEFAQHAIDRIILDSRPVHHARPDTPALLEARWKKTRWPVHALLTAQHSTIRFIGNEDIANNSRYFAPWIDKLKVWQEHSPYLFIHTPDISNVLPLALAIWPLLEPVIAACPPRPDWPQQDTLF